MHTVYAALSDIGEVQAGESKGEAAARRLETAFEPYTVEVAVDSVEIYAATDRDMALADVLAPDDAGPEDLSQTAGDGIAVSRDRDDLSELLQCIIPYDRTCFAQFTVRAISPSPVSCRSR